MSDGPAGRMLRAHIVSQILFHTEADTQSRILSLGSAGVEPLLAPYVGEIVRMETGIPVQHETFDAVIAVQAPGLHQFARSAAEWLRPGGVIYTLDSNRDRRSVQQALEDAGFETRAEIYDFASSRLATLLPAWGKTYLVSRLIDDWILRMPGLRALGGNVQLIARKPRQVS